MRVLALGNRFKEVSNDSGVVANATVYGQYQIKLRV